MKPFKSRPSFLEEKCSQLIRLRIEPGRLAAWREANGEKSLSAAIKKACDLVFLRQSAKREQ
jgi:hypothetical protein